MPPQDVNGQPQQRRVPPHERATFKLDVKVDGLVPGTEETHTFNYVAGMQSDEAVLLLGNQNQQPIALFPLRVVRAVLVDGNDVLAEKPSGLVLPFPGISKPRLIQ